jgi:C-terminal processing protease CtpA/Prc
VGVLRRLVRPVFGLSLAFCLGWTFTPAFGQGTLPTTTNSADQLKAKAIDLEREAKWEQALQSWCKLYGIDRQDEEANKHIQICLRRMLQSQRQTDASVREKVLSLSHTQSLALYGEVLTTLNSSYVDRTKAAPGRLFQQGLDEFLISLNDPKFRKLHLPNARDSAIRLFDNQLREYLGVREIESVTDAVETVKRIAATAKRDLHMNKTSAVVLEFIGGACNSLDEYTSYLSPAEVLSETRSTMESSIPDFYLNKDGIGYFKITHFRDTTPEELDNVLSTWKAMPGMNLRALVMDLRGNTGGLFSSAVQVVERFVPNGVIVSTSGRLDEFNKIYNAGARMNVTDLPLVVLVDGMTASAAEVLAGAFRDRQRATLVGTQTYGKGSIQRVLQFKTGEDVEDQGKAEPRCGGIRITLARFYTPNGQALSGAGVSPHLVIQEKARQFDAAMEQASRYVSGMTPR